MTARDSRLLNRRALFFAGAGALGAAFVAVAGRGGSSAPDHQAYASPTDSRHNRGGNVTCSCPICSGYDLDRRSADA